MKRIFSSGFCGNTKDPRRIAQNDVALGLVEESAFRSESFNKEFSRELQHSLRQPKQPMGPPVFVTGGGERNEVAENNETAVAM